MTTKTEWQLNIINSDRSGEIFVFDSETEALSFFYDKLCPGWRAAEVLPPREILLRFVVRYEGTAKP